MDLTGVDVATVGVLADVDGLVGAIQISPLLARSASVCLPRLRQRQLVPQPRRPRLGHPHRQLLGHPQHRRRDQIPICQQVVAALGLVLKRSMSAATVQLGARPTLPIARRVRVIGLVLTGHAQHRLLFQFLRVVAARGLCQPKRRRAATARLGARPPPAIAPHATVIGSTRAQCEISTKLCLNSARSGKIPKTSWTSNKQLEPAPHGKRSIWCRSGAVAS